MGRLRRWAPYVGVIVTALMLTISSNIAHMEQANVYTTPVMDVDTIYEGQQFRDTVGKSRDSAGVLSVLIYHHASLSGLLYPLSINLWQGAC